MLESRQLLTVVAVDDSFEIDEGGFLDSQSIIDAGQTWFYNGSSRT
jgi:hypothetical protein